MSGSTTRANRKGVPATSATVPASSSSSSSSSRGMTHGDDEPQEEGSDSEETQRQQLLSALQHQHQQDDEQQEEGPTDTATAELTAQLLLLQQEVATGQQQQAERHAKAATAALATATAVQRQTIQAQIHAQMETLAQLKAQRVADEQLAKRTAATAAAGGAALSASSQSQHALSLAATPLATPMPKYKGLTPTELHAVDAAKGTTLEDWIYSVERLIDQSEITDFGRQMRIAGGFWDRQVNTWWTAHAEMMRHKGEPIVDWAGWVAALRANYTAVSDADTACGLLFQLTMKAGESMDRYVGRAHELYTRIPRRRVTAEAAAEHMQRGVDARRYPLTLVSIGIEQQRERTKTGGGGLSFEALRGLLVEAAVREPQSLIAAAAAAPSSNRGQQRVNAVGQRQSRYPQPDEQGEDGLDDDDSQALNALDAASVTCYRCRQQGHIASSCTNKDTRRCNKCKIAGHIARDCPKQQPGGRGGRPSKNGAPPTTAGSKNV
jgi:hypothetical protein